MDYEAQRKADTLALMAMIDGTIEKIDCQAAIVTDSLGELRRQARALSKRRGGPGSRDALQYALGSVLAMLGLADIGDTALLGLFAHPKAITRWMGRELSRAPDAGFGALIAAVLADDRRRAWCERWGRILQWRYRKPLYDAAVQSFIDSGRTGPNEPWRRHDITEDQQSLMLTLADLLGEPIADIRTKGEAFDWIYARGGNPTYWAEPALPDDLEDA